MALRVCAYQLAEVVTNIYNLSLRQAAVPTCLKITNIVPLSKKSAVGCLNDYYPVALTSVIMKCFEWLVLSHIKASISTYLYKHQFAYRVNRSTDYCIVYSLDPS